MNAALATSTAMETIDNVIPVTKNRGIKEIAVGRSDSYRVNPRDLRVRADWNCRDLESEEAQASLAELSASIIAVGVKQPITVVIENGELFVTDGHRRYFATMMAIEAGHDIKSVPVQPEERYSSPADHVFSMIVRNSGEPLKPLEAARVYKKLIDFGWTESEIAEKSGVQRQRVVDLLDLQAAPVAVTTLVKTGKISSTLAIAKLREHRDNPTLAVSELSKAVSTAEALGKKKATQKHLTEKSSLKKELKSFFENVTIEGDTKAKSFVIRLTGDEHDYLMSALGITGKK